MVARAEVGNLPPVVKPLPLEGSMPGEEGRGVSTALCATAAEKKP
jgi:hypothetical protein